MKDITLEVADIFRAYDQSFLETFGNVTSSRPAAHAPRPRACRTAALGGRVEECNRCGHRVIAYNSCRNRHCPKCQASTRAAWLAGQTKTFWTSSTFMSSSPFPTVLDQSPCKTVFRLQRAV